MLGWFKRKANLKELEDRYRDLMQKSFQTSMDDPKKSTKTRRQANKVFEEIKYSNGK